MRKYSASEAPGASAMWMMKWPSRSSGRNVVLTKERQDSKAQNNQVSDPSYHYLGTSLDCDQERPIAVLEPTSERCITVGQIAISKQQQAKGWRDGQSHKQRGENCQDVRQTQRHRGRRLEYFTIVWNSLEGLIAVAAGIVAGSISLVGFGMDSFIEVTSGATLLWRMSVDADVESRERNEKLSLRIVGFCFIALAVY